MKTFSDIGINKNIIRSIESLGFQEPTPVQTEVVPFILEQRGDLVSLAQTGTGKTAAFGLPLIQLTNTKKRQVQTLILCPTRELCVQVTKDLEAFSKHTQNLKILAIYGGSSIEQQIRSLRQGVHMIVATPGRLNDLIKRGQVHLSSVGYVVFDEADEMMQMGFKDELDAILAHTPADKNTLLFSATMSKEVAAIAGKYMSNPEELTIGKRNAGADNVSHEYYLVHSGNLYPALKRIVDNCPNNYSIIFCRTRKDTQVVADKLISDGYNADALHGELSQPQRDQVMKNFRCKNLQILVATDVAARGLDVNDLTHVINYNLPDDVSAYTHRSGRTGRAGRTGTSISLVPINKKYRIKQIENKIKKKFNQCTIPSGEEVCKKQLVNLVDSIANVDVDHDRIALLFSDISQKLASFDREELIKKFVSLELNRLLRYYKDAPDLNVNNRSNIKKQPGKGGKFTHPANSRQKFTRFLVNAGRRQGIVPQGLIGLINTIPGTQRIKIGKIEIFRNTATLEADGRYTPQVLEAFQNATINGKTVTIKIDRTKKTTGKPQQNSPHHRKKRPRKAAA